MLGILRIMLTAKNLLAMAVGVTEGIIVGAIPGLTSVTAITLLLPISFSMPAETALLLLGSAYCGSLYGGAITAILVNAPGTPSAAATCLDGYPLATKGRASEALGMAAFASFFGGEFSALCLLLFAPPIARFALKFGMPEYFAVSIFGLTLIVALSSKSLLKGLISGILGLIVASIGMDPITGYARYSFGLTQLVTGIPLVPALIGLLSMSQALVLAEEQSAVGTVVLKKVGRWLPSVKVFRQHFITLLRSSVIGVVVGAIPGAGGSIASFLAYDDARRSSRNPEKFGTGVPEGVAATESANNAVSGGSLATMLTLGIPGSNVTAVMLGALMIHGLRPGPQFFSATPQIAYTFMYGLLVANAMMLLIGLFFAPYFAHVSTCPNYILIPFIGAFSVVGAFSVQNSVFDVGLMLIFAVIGYAMRRTGFSPVPMVLAMVLGPIAEKGFRTALVLSHGSYAIFFTRPISATLLLLSVLAVLWPLIRERGRGVKSGKKMVEHSGS